VKIKQIDHIGIAVQDLESAKQFYEEKLGISIGPEEKVGDMKIAFVPVGEVKIELIEPMSEDGVIGKFISKRGEGFHHIAYEVEDMEKALVALKDGGVKLIDATPRPGAGGKKVAFVHPKETQGVLTEIVEKKRVDS
jgi:methylmalonyl-CoA epimerase